MLTLKPETRVRIEIDGKKIAGKQILGTCRLNVEHGETAVLLGPSGCGKSTLLRMLIGLDAEFDGVITTGYERAKRSAISNCSMVFQEPRLLPWLSVLDNVKFALPDRMDKREKLRRCRETLALVGLEDALDKLPRQLSGGMAQRAALARALVNLPEVLLLDEPFRAVDLLTRMRLQDELDKILAMTSTTTILVTHDIDEAIRLGDKIAVMSGAPGSIMSVRRNSRTATRDSLASANIRRELIAELMQERQVS
jgi:sulfonate transport system ATP-binding protein